MKTKPIIYLSHSIRGDGSVSIQENCHRAKRLGKKLRKVFPEIEWYLPGETDMVLQILWKNGVISSDEILEADCEFLRTCHGWAWWHTGPSRGCVIEEHEAIECGLIDYALETQGRITVNLLKSNFAQLRRIFMPIVEKAKRRALQENQTKKPY